ncbi:M23 family metallopeptidase [bacterium]|nr:M23 family metallopeptidase [bacterium]
MAGKQFIVLMGQADNPDLKSVVFPQRKLILFGSLFVLAVLCLAYILGRGFQGVETNYRAQKAIHENRVLKNSLDVWEQRFDEMRVELDDLNKRNRQIRMTAALSSPDVEMGVGGPESMPRPGLMDVPRLQEMELNLARFEADMNWLKMSTIEIESQMDSKYKEIAHYPSIRPIKGGWLTSGFGMRKDPFTGADEMHNAIDVAIRPGSEVMATGAGVVKHVNHKVIKNKGFGKYIIIDHGYGYETLYGHLSEIFVKKGQQVKRWDLIGLTGNTGKSTAPHLHYGVSVNGDFKDPVNFILD